MDWTSKTSYFSKKTGEASPFPDALLQHGTATFHEDMESNYPLVNHGHSPWLNRLQQEHCYETPEVNFHKQFCNFHLYLLVAWISSSYEEARAAMGGACEEKAKVLQLNFQLTNTVNGQPSEGTMLHACPNRAFRLHSQLTFDSTSTRRDAKEQPWSWVPVKLENF